MSALAEKVAREHHHWAGLGECRCGALIPEVGCGDNRDLYAEHIAYITEAATRAAVAADIRDRLNTADLIRLADTYSGYYQGVRAGYQDAIEIVGGKP